ncbi:MAG: penicillin-binding transpeptidase domain-containing protein, partial [Bacillota bacterium]
FPRPKPVQVISPSTAAWLRNALFDATRSGSASAAFIEGLGSAGKTGSAETGKRAGGQNVLHAWFAGYAPAYAPRYVCCVFVEEGGYGGTVAAPLFHDIMAELLRRPPAPAQSR